MTHEVTYRVHYWLLFSEGHANIELIFTTKMTALIWGGATFFDQYLILWDSYHTKGGPR